MTLRRRPCCKHQQVKHTCNSLPLRPVPGSRRGRGRARLQLQALSAGRWGWLGWIPRSGLPSHIHTQNVCGTVNHFFKYRTVAVAAGGGLASAGVASGDLFEAALDAEKKQVMVGTRQEPCRPPCH